MSSKKRPSVDRAAKTLQRASRKYLDDRKKLKPWVILNYYNPDLPNNKSEYRIITNPDGSKRLALNTRRNVERKQEKEDAAKRKRQEAKNRSSRLREMTRRARSAVNPRASTSISPPSTSRRQSNLRSGPNGGRIIGPLGQVNQAMYNETKKQTNRARLNREYYGDSI